MGGSRKQSRPSRCPALANFCHLKLNPSLTFLGPAARGTKLISCPRTSDERCAPPGMPDAERSSLGLPCNRLLSWPGRHGNKAEDSLPSANTYAQSIHTAEKCFCLRPTPDPSEDPGSRPVRRRRALARCVYHGPFGTCFLAGVNVPTAPTRPSDVECLPFSFLMDEPGVIFALVAALCFSSFTPSHTPPFHIPLLTFLPPLGLFFPFQSDLTRPYPHVHIHVTCLPKDDGRRWGCFKRLNDTDTLLLTLHPTTTSVSTISLLSTAHSPSHTTRATRQNPSSDHLTGSDIDLGAILFPRFRSGRHCKQSPMSFAGSILLRIVDPDPLP